MRTLLDRAPQRPHRDTLLVLLPPSLASIDDLVTQGFVDAVRQRHLPVDLLLADLHSQTAIDGNAAAMLHDAVVLPAQAQGYRHLWLAGISIGAFNALSYAAQHADRLAGMYLIAPYPGTQDVLREIDQAGGPQPWLQRPHSQEHERVWWHWLAQQDRNGQWPTPVYMGTGDADRFLPGQQLLAQVLPPTCVHIIAGAHQWGTWQRLWADWLDHGPLAGIGPQPAPERP